MASIEITIPSELLPRIIRCECSPAAFDRIKEWMAKHHPLAEVVSNDAFPKRTLEGIWFLGIVTWSDGTAKHFLTKCDLASKEGEN